jgi:hypothetical protein
MDTPASFRAPWGWSLKVSTAIACAIVAVPTVYQLANGRPIGWLLLAVLVVPIFYMVRGYTITPTHLEVARLGWTSRWPLDGLRSATVERGIMARSLRTFGNGGLFSITGRFRNARLGAYRAFVTDTERTVVLRFPTATVVISPDDPAAFVRHLGARQLR